METTVACKENLDVLSKRVLPPTALSKPALLEQLGTVFAGRMIPHTIRSSDSRDGPGPGLLSQLRAQELQTACTI